MSSIEGFNEHSMLSCKIPAHETMIGVLFVPKQDLIGEAMSDVTKQGMCGYLAETCVAYQVPLFTKTLREQRVREEDIQGKVDAFSKQYLAKVAEAITGHYRDEDAPLLRVAYEFHQGTLHTTLSGIYIQAIYSAKDEVKSSACRLGMWIAGMGAKPPLKQLPDASELPVAEQSVEQLAAGISKISGDLLANVLDIPMIPDLGQRGTEALKDIVLNEAAIQRITLLKDSLTKAQLQQSLNYYSSEGGKKFNDLTPVLSKSAEALKKVFLV